MGNEPTEDEILAYMQLHNEYYWPAREILREIAYASEYPDKPSGISWGQYFKSM